MFKCQECGKEFKNKSGLGGHRASVHEGRASKGNPMVTLEGSKDNPLLTLKGFKSLWKHIQGCSNCRPLMLAALRDEGYTITDPGPTLKPEVLYKDPGDPGYDKVTGLPIWLLKSAVNKS